MGWFRCFVFNCCLSRVLTNCSPAKWLVAYGHMFTMLLDQNNLYIHNSKTEICFARCVLPPFRKSVRGSNFTPGDVQWLDGLHRETKSALVLATSMPDHSIFLLKTKDVTWKNLVTCNSKTNWTLCSSVSSDIFPFFC